LTHDQLLALVGLTVGCLVGLLTLGLSRAPGCGGLRWLGLITACAGVTGALRTAAGSFDEPTVWLFTRMGLSLTGVMVYAWWRYARSEAGRPPDRTERVLSTSALAFAVIAFVPGVAIRPSAVWHGDGLTAARYVDVPPTLFGMIGLCWLVGSATALLVRYTRQWAAGNRAAGAHALALAGLELSGTQDLVDGMFTHRSIHLLPLGLLWTVGCVGVALPADDTPAGGDLWPRGGDLGEEVVVGGVREPPLRERHPRLVLQVGAVE